MRTERFEWTSLMPCSRERLWRFHLRADALEVLSPPGTRVVNSGDGVREGSEVRLRLGMWPLARSWTALHTEVRAPEHFVDIATDGPFPYWVHQHRFEAVDGRRSKLRDVIHYLPPRGLDHRVGRWLCRQALAVLFRWRHRRTRAVVSPDAERRGHRVLRARIACGGGS